MYFTLNPVKVMKCTNNIYKNLTIKKGFLVSLLTAMLFAHSVYSQDNSIPSSRLPPDGWNEVIWNDPGGWTTIDVTTQGLAADNASLDAAQKIEDIIAVGSGNRILYFPAGTYYLKTTCDIAISGIQIKGVGSQTRFIIENPTDDKMDGFKVSGSSGAETTVTSSSLNRGAATLNVADASSYAPGDYLYLRLEAGKKAGWGEPLEAQIVRIESKSDNTLTIYPKLGRGFDPNEDPRVTEFQMVKNVVLRDFYIKRKNFRDRTLSSTPKDYNISMFRAQNTWITNIESDFATWHHIGIGRSFEVLVTDCYIHDYYHTEGNIRGDTGYGTLLHAASTACQITNNTLNNLRHAIIVNTTANHCIFSYNTVESTYHDYSDINDHSYGSHNNLYEGNVGRDITIDAWHEEYAGPYNTYFRNRAHSWIGDFNQNHTKTTVVGNHVGAAVFNEGSDGYVGANIVNGMMNWGALSTNASIPNSLYLNAKPAFLSTTEWPKYGPGSTFTEPTGAKYEAETAAHPGLSTSNTKSGYSGSGYVDFTGTASNNYIEWTVTGVTAGRKRLKFRYNNNGNNGQNNAQIRVNGSASLDRFALTRAFNGNTTWAFQVFDVDLTEGTNTIRLTSTINWNVSIDYLEVIGLEGEGGGTIFPDPTKWYVIQSDDNDNVLADNGSDADVRMWSFQTHNNRLFRFEASSVSPYYLIVSRERGKALSYSTATTTAKLWDQQDHENRRMKLEASSVNGYYHIINQQGNKYLANSTSENKARFWSPNDHDSLRWKLVEVETVNAQEAMMGNKEDIKQKAIGEPLFLLYPNPTQGQLKLDLPDYQSSGEMCMYNPQGKLVLKQLVFGSDIIDVSHLPGGLYTIRVQVGTMILTRKLIIK